MTLAAGSQLPAFTLDNQDGQKKSPADYTGKWLVLYVYPKDDTPGCTIQGQSFTATKDQFAAKNVVVVGISADSVESHRAFCDKFSFTVELLADPTHALLTALGVGQSEWKGTMYWDRTTFLVDPTGVVRKVYEKVVPQDHEKVLLADIAALS